MSQTRKARPLTKLLEIKIKDTPVDKSPTALAVLNNTLYVTSYDRNTVIMIACGGNRQKFLVDNGLIDTAVMTTKDSQNMAAHLLQQIASPKFDDVTFLFQ